MLLRISAPWRKLMKGVPAALFLLGVSVYAQDAAPAGKQALDSVLGTVTAMSAAEHTVTVKEDKTSTEYSVQLATTKTLLKVDPGAKDLKSATRITADDLQVGDRVQARGNKAAESPTILVARSVVLMSARDLAQAHQAQAAEWQHATTGVVTSVDAAGGKVSLTTKTAEGPKTVVLNTGKATEFTRYRPETPGTPGPSQLAQLQVGDQVRAVGDKTEDGSSVEARKVYSGAFRTISATVVSIAADGKSAMVKDLASKKPVEIALADDASIRRLPPMMAAMLARRLNPSAAAAGGSAGGNPGGAAPNGGNPGGNPGAGRPAGATPDASGGNPDSAAGRGRPDGAAPADGGAPHGGPGMGGPSGGPGMGGAGGMRRGNGDMSQMLERAPKITAADLKPGDALVISRVATGADNSRLLASTIIAGVEPILQSAPTRAGRQDVGGDWGLGEMAPPQ